MSVTSVYCSSYDCEYCEDGCCEYEGYLNLDEYGTCQRYRTKIIMDDEE